MGDRTQVELRVLSIHAKSTEALFTFEPEESYEGSEWTYFSFSEVNYGTLDFLPALISAGIAYDSHWESGHEYSEGTEHTRFNVNGEPVTITVYVTDENPSLHLLLEVIDDPLKLRNTILDHQARNTPLPWDNQEQYGKLYRAEKLITG